MKRIIREGYIGDHIAGSKVVQKSKYCRGGLTIELLTGRNPSAYEYIAVGLGSNDQFSYDALHLNC
jgi:hypothetical protein